MIDDTEETGPGMEGVRIYWIWSREESPLYNHESVFISRNLSERYEDGEYALHFDEGTLPIQPFSLEAEFDIDLSNLESAEQLINSEQIQNVLHQEEAPQGQWESTVLTADLRTAFNEGVVSRVVGWIRQSTSQNDTLNNYDKKEDDLRSQNADLDQLPT
ncbi:hypothetical protein DJ68_09280, partial [Halorubrum sp. C3]